jgi:hypothetical protein
VFPAALAGTDPQGATALLPAFQVALFAALCAAIFVTPQWRLCAVGFGVLALSLVAGLALLEMLQTQTSLVPHVREIRAWALAVPVLLVVAMVKYDGSRR